MTESLQIIQFLLNSCAQKDATIAQLQQQLKAQVEAQSKTVEEPKK